MRPLPNARRSVVDRTEAVARIVARKLRERPEQRLIFNLSGQQLREPRVYFLAPDDNRPSGGTRVIYRHADILRSAGIDAVVLHRRGGFRYTWFENRTVVGSVGDYVIGPADLLVVSELDVSVLARNYAYPRPCPRHVVLNQSGPYLTWQSYADELQVHYNSPNRPAAIVATSVYIADFARFAFPHIDVRPVRLSIDPSRFSPAESKPPPRITYMQRDIPGKQSDDAEVVFRILANTHVLRGWQTSAISGLPESEVAVAMRGSAIFLSLSAREGFGMPPLEAMASGCYVVGYHAQGGREYMREEISRPVEAGNVLQLAVALKDVINKESAQPGWLRETGLAASEYAHSHYAPSIEKADVIAAYSASI